MYDLLPILRFLYEDDENMSLVIKNVTSADAGEYHVIASNDLGEDTTTMNLVVKQAPKIKKKIENQTCMVSKVIELTRFMSTWRSSLKANAGRLVNYRCANLRQQRPNVIIN